MAKPVDCQCRAFKSAIAVLGRPWNALLLTVLQEGRLRYTEISQRAQGPGDKVLAARLKELEAHGLLLRHVEPGPPVRVSYELTDKGRAFEHLSHEIEKWGHALVDDARPRATRRS